MATISPLVKNALSYRTLSLMIILTSAMGIFIFIYSAYIQWGNNKASLINEDIITPLNDFNEKYKWNLSSSANNRIAAPPLVSGNVDTLSHIHLSGIIHSSDKLSSRAILQEGGNRMSILLMMCLNHPTARASLISLRTRCFSPQAETPRSLRCLPN